MLSGVDVRGRALYESRCEIETCCESKDLREALRVGHEVVKVVDR